MKCVISGGTGFIGRRIVELLLADGHYVGLWSRKPGLVTRSAIASFSWDPLAGDPPEESLNGMDAVLHLAGEPVAQRWNPAVKARIRDSRVIGTRRLVDTLARVPHKPKVLVCASAVGIYGDRGDEILTENSTPGNGFLADVCRSWEAEADRARKFGRAGCEASDRLRARNRWRRTWENCAGVSRFRRGQAGIGEAVDALDSRG